jgi:ribose 1,5-bisphosphokinase
MAREPGLLFLVAGPSGAGKDTLLDAARHRLSADPRFVFARRVITRPADAGGEDHIPASDADFAAQEAAGGFALSWRAHALAYGIPRSIDGFLAAGRHVVANVSRTVIAEATMRYPAVHVIHVTAPPALLRQRLAARRREDSTAQAARIARAGGVMTDAAIEIINDASVEVGVRRLLDALQDAVNGAR